MDAANASQYNMMRGMIALAWVDGVLDPGEVTLVERYIDHNNQLTPEQKHELKASIATPITIKEVWDTITDLRDRARLIDVAGAIFHADGDYSPVEKSAYNEMLAWHLKSLHRPVTNQAVKKMADEAMVEAKKAEAEYKQEVKNTPEKAPSKMGLLIYRINKTLGH